MMSDIAEEEVPEPFLWLEEYSKPFFVPSRGNLNGNLSSQKGILCRLVEFL